MAYINIDIEDHLDEAPLDYLIDEIAERYVRAKTEVKKDEIRKLLSEKFNFLPKNVIESMSISIDEQSKRELIEEFIGRVTYDQLKKTLESISGFRICN